MINQATITGRLAKFSEVKMTQSGKKMAKFSVYQARKDSKQYIPVLAFDRPAEFFEKNLHEGDYIECRGRLSVSSRTDSTGRKISELNFIADSIDKVWEQKPQQAQQAPQPAPEPPKQERYTDDMFSRAFENINPDDLPF